MPTGEAGGVQPGQEAELSGNDFPPMRPAPPQLLLLFSLLLFSSPTLATLQIWDKLQGILAKLKPKASPALLPGCFQLAVLSLMVVTPTA